MSELRIDFFIRY